MYAAHAQLTQVTPLAVIVLSAAGSGWAGADVGLAAAEAAWPE
jgi:hypothetical protein